MKVTTIALATAFTLTSTIALAQLPGTAGYGSVVQPSVGSYPTTVGSTNVVPTWSNTGPQRLCPAAPLFLQCLSPLRWCERPGVAGRRKPAFARVMPKLPMIKAATARRLS